MKKSWTKERCKEEALKYEFRGEFQKKSKSAYNASIKHNILDEICSHMKIIGHRYKRCVYSYEFDDNHVYVGLTYNLDKRHRKHLENGSVYDHIQLNKNYVVKQLTEYIDVKLAIQKENYFVDYYRNKNHIILNKVKTGSVGTLSKWTKEKCHTEALKHSSRFEFQKKSSGAYNFAFLNNWLNEICSHMESKIWTKEKCHVEALKYKSRKEYRKNASGSYSAALKNKWLNEICSHMELLVIRNYWTKEKCHSEALKYKNRTEFSKKSRYPYRLSSENKWLDEICKHMI